MAHVTIDFETYSEADLKEVGAWKYAEHPTTDIIMLGWAIDDEAPSLWLPGQPVPDRLRKAIEDAFTVDAHNAAFEEAIWTRLAVPVYGFPEIEPRQWDDTMARAAERALPLSLDRLGSALALDRLKDPAGKRLMGLLSSPPRPTKKNPRPERNRDPELLDQYGRYCLSDVAAERAVRRRLGHSPIHARKAYLLNEEINRRGFMVDLDAVRAARDVVAQVEERLGGEFTKLTGLGPNQRDKLLEWFHGEGVHLDDLTADTVKAEVAKRHPGKAGRALELRAILAKASTKKLARFAGMACEDGRVRGTQQYHGAFTGRTAGRGLQPLNFPRPSDETTDWSWLIETIKTRDVEALDMIYGDAMRAVSDALRPMIVAAPGKKLVAADLTAIEAVGLACLAGEERKIDVFRRKEDVYCATASLIFGYPVKDKKTHPRERQVGKTGELAFGYGGGVGAWRNFDDSPTHSDDDVRGYRDMWRAAHPAVTAFWNGLEAAALEAMATRRGEYAGVEYRRVGTDLICRLPSGRVICYPEPKVVSFPAPWDEARTLTGLSYMSQKDGQWKRVRTWGGKLTENVTQAACCDVLREGMHLTQDENLPIVLTVYDEVVCEVDESDDTALERLVECMTAPAGWRGVWPVGAEGWEGERYHK